MKSVYKIMWVPAILLTLQSCFVAKDYEKPEDIVHEDYFRTDSIAKDSTSMAAISWEDMFTDPLLQKYINHGLENNIDIRQAIQQMTIAQSYVKQDNLGNVPTLSAGASFTRNYYSENGQMGATLGDTGRDHFDLTELSANLSWEADIWGKIRSRKRASAATYLQTVAAHKAVKTKLIANIASTYYQLLALDQQISVTEETVENRENSLETIKALKLAGQVNSAAVEQTKAQYYTAKGILVDLKKQSRLIENTLCLLMGDEPHSIERTKLDDQEIDTDLKSGVPALLLQNRPDVLAAEMNYRNAFEMTNIAETNFYPSLTINASGGLQSIDIDKLFNANSLFANLVGGLTAPVFNGRQIRTQYEVSQAQQEQAKLNYRGVLIQASKEVSDAIYTYDSSTEKISLNQQEYEAYKQAVEDSQALLNNGLANYLEVLTAQESALNARLDVIDSRVTQLTSIVDLYQALGGGWQ